MTTRPVKGRPEKSQPEKSQKDGLWGIIRTAACFGLAIFTMASTMGWMEKRGGLDSGRATQKAEAFARWYCHKTGSPPGCQPKLAEVTAIPVSDGRQTVAWRFRFDLTPPQILPKRQLVVKVNPIGSVQLASVPIGLRK